jgi:putative glutamine amidotransferase
MPQPLIGITTGEIINHTNPWSPITYGQSHTYSDAIFRAGGVPVLIPITDNIEALQELYDRLDGILFTGGNDIDPELYHKSLNPKTKDVSKRRDQVEVNLMKWALDDNKPILAICRGAQLLNVICGGSLYQDIDSEVEGASDHGASTAKEDIEHIAHHLTVDNDSIFGQIIEGSGIAANTHHHQAIKDIAPNLKITARAEDGIIEGVEIPDAKFVLGIQCHPESLQNIEPKWNLVFGSFIQKSTPVS